MKQMPFNLDLLHELMGGADGYIDKFIDVCIAELPLQMVALRRALDHGNQDEVSILAHGIKSQLKYLMAAEAVSIAAELENAAQENAEETRLTELCDRLLVEVDTICAGLKQIKEASEKPIS